MRNMNDDKQICIRRLEDQLAVFKGEKPGYDIDDEMCKSLYVGEDDDDLTLEQTLGHLQQIKDISELLIHERGEAQDHIEYASNCVEIADTVMDTARQQSEYQEAVDVLMQIKPEEERDKYENVTLIECLYNLLCAYENSEADSDELKKTRSALMIETLRLEQQHLAPNNIQKYYMGVAYVESAENLTASSPEQDTAFEKGIHCLYQFILSSGNTNAHNYYRLGDAYALYAESTFNPCKKQKLLEKAKEALETSYQHEKNTDTLEYLQDVKELLSDST